MPYFSDTASAPHITDEKTSRIEDFWTPLGIGGVDGRAHTYRLVTTQQYRLTALTEAAALAAATPAVLDSYSRTTRSARRISQDGQFQLQVTRDSWADWTTDTYAADT